MNEATEVLPRQAPQIKFSESDKERFWSKVKKSDDGCWTWLGKTGATGYGKFWINDKTISAHRAMLLMTLDPDGRNDYGNLFACHHCDVRECVNPAHLYFGTPQQNVMDMVKRGRNAKGSLCGASTLFEADVIEIRRLYSTGKTSSLKLARMFGVNKTAILKIINGKTWRHLDSISAPTGARKADYLTFVEELFRWG